MNGISCKCQWPLFGPRMSHGPQTLRAARKKVRGTRNSRTGPRGPWRDAYVSFGPIGRFLQTGCWWPISSKKGQRDTELWTPSQGPVTGRVCQFRGDRTTPNLVRPLESGNKLVAPTFNEGQKLDGNLIQRFVYGETSDSEENCEEEEVETFGTDDEWPSHSSKTCKEQTGNPTFVSASAKTSTAELPATESHAMAISISKQLVEQLSTNAQASSSSQQGTSQSNSPTSRRWQNDYGTYINLINDSLDEDEDEEMYTAIIASIEDQT
ncbi:unnamed protein product [Leuciscus chuanchicus]